VVMRKRGIEANLAIATSMGFAASSAAILALVLRRLRPG